MKKSLILLLGLALLTLAACSPSTQTPANANPGVAPTQGNQPNAAQAGYPAAVPTDAYPVQSTPGEVNSTMNAYPAPQNPNEPGSLYPPADADNALTRGNFILDSASLQARADEPGRADLVATGSLPTSCNQIRVKLNPPDAQNKIAVDVYSVAEKGKICTQALKPFQGKLALLGGYPAGKYSVVVNDKPAGELTVP